MNKGLKTPCQIYKKRGKQHNRFPTNKFELWPAKPNGGYFFKQLILEINGITQNYFMKNP